MLLYKKLLLMTFGTTYVINVRNHKNSRTMHSHVLQ